MSDTTIFDTPDTDDLASGIRPIHGVNEAPLLKIDWFDGTVFDFLSNFHPSTFTLPKRVYATLGSLLVRMHADDLCEIEWANGEAAFQAFKMAYVTDFIDIAKSEGPDHAKSLGRTREMRSDWNAVKVDVMREVLRAKFSDQNPLLVKKLLATGYADLIEGNTWGDAVWGVPKTKYRFAGSERGENLLGLLLMQRRAELRLGY